MAQDCAVAIMSEYAALRQMDSAARRYEADVLIVGLGAAGGCAAIEAHDNGASVMVLEKQAEDRHYSNTRMSGGGFHSPDPDGDAASLRAYAKAMFSGDNLPLTIEGAQPEFSDELADLWARLSPGNEAFMRGLDPLYKTVKISNAAFDHFPGADKSGYAVVKSTYTGATDEATQFRPTRGADKTQKEAGEAFHTCLMNGLQTRGIPVFYGTRALSLIVEDGEIVGVQSERDGEVVSHYARRAVVLTCGGYEYNRQMRKAFLDGPGGEGWAFYGSPANTGDGIRMAMKVGAALTHVSSIAGRVICALPERRHGLKIGLNTSSVGKPNEIVVDSRGERYASERRITKDPSRYIFYREALQFDTHTMSYPRIPSWMIFDETLRKAGPLVRLGASGYNNIDWGADNLNAIKNGWVLKADTLEELAELIGRHPDDRGRMDAAVLKQTVARWNAHCAARHDPDFARDPQTMGPVDTPPFYAMPLSPGGPNTKGGIRANPQRQVLDWDDEPIPRLYTAGEISSVFQFAYQGGGNLAEGITFGRLAGRNAAAQAPRSSRRVA
jgi:succinate dehydrogenase/fumarate reductase flavoprotein subunit